MEIIVAQRHRLRGRTKAIPLSSVAPINLFIKTKSIMDVLDKPSTPDPATVPYRQIAFRYGGIWAAISVVLTLLGFITGMDPSLPTTATGVKAVFYLLSFGVTIWAIASAIKEDRDKQLGGFINLGRCLGLGTLTALIASAISGLFTALYMTVINPGYQDQMKEAMMTQYEQQGMSEEQIEMALGIAANFTSPVMICIFAVVFGTLFGFIFSLIIGAIMKREALR